MFNSTLVNDIDDMYIRDANVDVYERRGRTKVEPKKDQVAILSHPQTT